MKQYQDNVINVEICIANEKNKFVMDSNPANTLANIKNYLRDIGRVREGESIFLNRGTDAIIKNFDTKVGDLAPKNNVIKLVFYNSFDLRLKTNITYLGTKITFTYSQDHTLQDVITSLTKEKFIKRPDKDQVVQFKRANQYLKDLSQTLFQVSDCGVELNLELIIKYHNILDDQNLRNIESQIRTLKQDILQTKFGEKIVIIDVPSPNMLQNGNRFAINQ